MSTERGKLNAMNGTEWPEAVGGIWDANRSRFSTAWEDLPNHDQVAVYRILTREPQQVTTEEELDALPEGTLIACVKANPKWPDVFLHTGSSRAPWLHLDPSDREDGETTTTSGAVLRWHGNGSATVMHTP